MVSALLGTYNNASASVLCESPSVSTRLTWCKVENYRYLDLTPDPPILAPLRMVPEDLSGFFSY